LAAPFFCPVALRGRDEARLWAAIVIAGTGNFDLQPPHDVFMGNDALPISKSPIKEICIGVADRPRRSVTPAFTGFRHHRRKGWLRPPCSSRQSLLHWFIVAAEQPHQQLGGLGAAGIARHQVVGLRRLIPTLALCVGFRFRPFQLRDHTAFQNIGEDGAGVEMRYELLQPIATQMDGVSQGG